MKKGRQAFLRARLLCGLMVALQSGFAVAASCTVNSPLLAFGEYQPLLGLPADSTTTITVSCSAMSGDVSYTLALSTPGGGRIMNSGIYSLGYGLYTNAGRTVEWNDTTQLVSGTVVNNNGNGSRDNTVYGRIPSGQTSVGPGNYNNAANPVTITVTY